MLRLKCTKFDFGWGSAPDPLWRSLQLQCSLKPLSEFKRADPGGWGMPPLLAV